MEVHPHRVRLDDAGRHFADFFIPILRRYTLLESAYSRF